MEIKLKRVYSDAAPGDGYRVLVDRLWPRGISKDSARLDHWAKEIAPSTELRQWFKGGSGDFDDFRLRYIEELREAPDRLADLRSRARKGTLTLIYAARDEQQNHAAVLAEVIRRGLPEN
ncbi:MAG: DUF488 family protein [Thermoleophilia bacterium]|nr:DUF488 family protein [Thermoleophilia bacterium]